MRIMSNEIHRVFKAYARQLRSDYAKGLPGQIRDTRAKGFEKVEISDEARTLAANLPETVQQQSAANRQDRVAEKRKDDERAQKEEKEPEKSKEGTDNSRSEEVVD